MYDHYEDGSSSANDDDGELSSVKSKQSQREKRRETEKEENEEKRGREESGDGQRWKKEQKMGEKREMEEEKEQKMREKRDMEEEKEKDQQQKKGTKGGRTTATKWSSSSPKRGTKRTEQQQKQNIRPNVPTMATHSDRSRTSVGKVLRNAEQTERDDANGTDLTVPTRALGQDEFDHFSFTCHLFPRLSESNLQFHDIYWDRDPSTKFVTLRKRKVFVNKLVRSLRVRPIGAAATENDATHRRTEFRADFSLIDRRPFARREIVSNIFSVEVPFLSGGGARRIFRKTTASVSVLVRSNYRQRAVALQILLQRSTTTNGGPSSLHLVGRAELELLDENAKMAIANRIHSLTFDGKVRFEFETVDIPNREQIQADSLPDVLICDERWLPMLAIYRQLICETLSEDGDVFADRSVWVIDSVMATFPALLDKDADGVALLMTLMHKFSVDNRELSPQESARRFRFVYMHFILPLTALVDDRRWRENLWAFAKGRMDIEEPNPIRAMATEPCKAMDIFEYALNLCGEHSID